jgi:hypothetical protein
MIKAGKGDDAFIDMLMALFAQEVPQEIMYVPGSRGFKATWADNIAVAALDPLDELLTGSLWPESSIDQVFHRAFSHLPLPLTVRMDRPHSCPWRSCQHGC